MFDLACCTCLLGTASASFHQPTLVTTFVSLPLVSLVSPTLSSPTSLSRLPPSMASDILSRAFSSSRKLVTQPIAMPCRLLAWFLRRLMPFNRPRPPRDLQSAQLVDLETLRARHPLKRTLNPPIPTDSPTEAAYLAGATALPGLVMASLDETHPCMIIARAAQAISIAASTSQSHAALLAAVNTMETFAILSYEDKCETGPVLNKNSENLFKSIDAPVRRALAQKPPSNPFIPHYDPPLPGQVPADLALACRAFLESWILNLHIFRPGQ